MFPSCYMFYMKNPPLSHLLYISPGSTTGGTGYTVTYHESWQWNLEQCRLVTVQRAWNKRFWLGRSQHLWVGSTFTPWNLQPEPRRAECQCAQSRARLRRTESPWRRWPLAGDRDRPGDTLRVRAARALSLVSELPPWLRSQDPTCDPSQPMARAAASNLDHSNQFNCVAKFKLLRVSRKDLNYTRILLHWHSAVTVAMTRTKQLFQVQASPSWFSGTWSSSCLSERVEG